MVHGRSENQLAAVLFAKNHQIISGVNEKSGGGNEGFDPHELLESALAACTIITVEMYAKRKSWNLQSIEVSVRIETDNAISVVERKIAIVGNLDDIQRSRLLEIADKCPIHRILTQKMEIKTTLKI